MVNGKQVVLFLSLLAACLPSLLADVNCNQHPDFRSLKSCCRTPEASFAAFADQCGSFIPNKEPPSPCLFECIFNATNTLSGTALNIGNARSMLSQVLSGNQEFVDAYATGLEDCSKQVDDIERFSKNPPPIPMAQMAKCSPVSMYYSMCAHKYVFTHCPSGSWSNTDACNAGKEFVETCKPKRGAGGRMGGRPGFG